MHAPSGEAGASARQLGMDCRAPLKPGGVAGATYGGNKKQVFLSAHPFQMRHPEHPVSASIHLRARGSAPSRSPSPPPIPAPASPSFVPAPRLARRRRPPRLSPLASFCPPPCSRPSSRCPHRPCLGLGFPLVALAALRSPRRGCGCAAPSWCCPARMTGLVVSLLSTAKGSEWGRRHNGRRGARSGGRKGTGGNALRNQRVLPTSQRWVEDRA